MLDYSAGVRGPRNTSTCGSVQNSATRYFWGVHKYAPKLAIVGDKGWEPCEACLKICTVQSWNWLRDMEESRLTRKIFIWDKKIIGSWSRDLCTLFYNYGFEEAFINYEKL